jgi:DNA-binding Lrp family transcriptional regulator/hypoxanthine-guanine phosphoribosyltransferase
MITATRNQILTIIQNKGQSRVHELVRELGISRMAVHKQLKKLCDEGLLEKSGKPPKVYYALASPKYSSEVNESSSLMYQAAQDTIEERYLYISPTGNVTYGMRGFQDWCAKTKQEVEKTAHEYIATLRKYDVYRKHGVIDGMMKIRKTFPSVVLDKLFYLDFYSIERFGKTKLGQLLLYAKQGQDRSLIKSLCQTIHPQILQIVNDYHIDGVLYVPPTVRREIQFMKELEKNLELPIRTLSVTKIKTQVSIPQKTLTKLEDRVENARKTIIVDETQSFNNILLIDDAIGSGATMNETALQVKKKGIYRGSLIGLAITGSFKGFDVISEV